MISPSFNILRRSVLFRSTEACRTGVLRRSLASSSNPGPGAQIRRGPVTWIGLTLTAVASASAVGYYKIERERKADEKFREVTTSGKPDIGGTWTLVDMNGHLVNEATYAGKYTLLYFGFAHCPDICPSELAKVAQVMDRLQKEHPEVAEKIVPLFVTVDPARDSMTCLKEYGKDFHPKLQFLTGTPEQVQKMTKKYRVYISKADEMDDGDYLVDHSIVLYFNNPDGTFQDFFSQSMRATDIVSKIKAHLLPT